MTRLSRLLLLGASALAAAPATAGTTFLPYAELQQVFAADLSGHGDSVTYTGIGAGFDLTSQGRRLQAQVDYRYDHYFSWSHRYADGDIHDGIARANYLLSPGLTLEGAAFASRGHFAGEAAAPGLLAGDLVNSDQIYGVDLGPSYTGHFGDLDVRGDYRFDYVHSDDGLGTFDLGPGQPVLDNGFGTTSHTLDASIGMRPGILPVGWTVSGGWVRDSIGFLDARYTGAFGRVDLVKPVSYAVALEAGAGYESNRADQQPLLVDAAGNAILDSHRRLQGDPSKPRLLSYDEQGLTWDVGVLWRPDTRTSLEVRGGRRYGEAAVTGSFSHQMSPNAQIQAVAYDDIESFGRQLGQAFGSLPTSFLSPVLTIGGGLQGCVFGSNGGGGTCVPALSEITASLYRTRGGYVMLSAQHGPWTYGLGAGYSRRHFLVPATQTALVSITGADDQEINADLVVARRLGRSASLTGTADVIWYDSGLPSIGSYVSYGATGTYARELSRHLSGSASVSLYSGAGGIVQDDVYGTAILAVRYHL